MKINKITIQGMHGIVAPKTYNLNDHNYFYGKNGAGKSTILQAIQLALLGYIPGYDKTSKSIYQHSNSKSMIVTLELLDRDNIIRIERSWTKVGESIKSDNTISGTTMKIDDIVNELILPVYDFNDFMKLSSNKMKEWFLEFLPSQSVKIDWDSELTNVTTNYPHSQEIKDNILKRIMQLNKDGKELIVEVHSYIKELISYTKAQVDSIQNTIKELVRYDDAPIKSAEQLREDLNRLNELKIDRERWLVNKERNKEAEAELKLYLSKYFAPSGIEDPKYLRYQNAIAQLRIKIHELKAEQPELKNRINELNQNLVQLQNEIKHKHEIIDTEGICPLCKSHIAHLVDGAKTEVAQLENEFDTKYKELQSLKEQYEKNDEKLKELDTEFNEAVNSSTEIMNAYTHIQNLEAQLSALPERTDLETNYDDLIKELTDDLIKVEANKRYDSLITELTSKKIVSESNLELLKELKKLTDVNGLQTKAIAQSPFKNLKEKMDEMLVTVFGQSYEAHFIEDGKSNSFDFGVLIDGKYVSYTTLSSGEKCLFTLALTLSLLSLSNSRIKMLLVDDLFDHLDKDNANKLFTSLYNMKDNIQTVFAGVNKPDNIEAIEIK